MREGIKLHRQSRNESLCLQLEVVSPPSTTLKYGAPRWGTPYFGAGGGTLNPAERSSATNCAYREEARALYGSLKWFLTLHQHQNTGHPVGVPRILVPVVGLEPTRCRHQRILSPSRLPIPSHRRIWCCLCEQRVYCITLLGKSQVDSAVFLSFFFLFTEHSFLSTVT